jgi:hypothetical protein
MDDRDEVFQCQYCGRFAPLRDALIAWAEDWQTDKDRLVFTMAVTCAPPCADKVNQLRVAQ